MLALAASQSCRSHTTVRHAGEAGLPTGRGAYLINPNEDVYFELNMVDGGSGKCVRTLAPEGVSLRGQAAMKSISCELGKP